MRKLIFNLLVLIALASCNEPDEPAFVDTVINRVSFNGFFIVNEGNFGWGNGSLTYFSYDSIKTYNNIFRSVNNKPLGDVPYSMMFYGENIYIVVNNSEKIEVIDRKSLESIKTIYGFISPRNIALAGPNKAYVTSMYSDSLKILDLKENEVTGSINIKNSSESILVKGSKAFVANWIEGNEIFIVNTETDELVDSLEVGPEPESMVSDKNGNIWVLCNGGWMREHFAELICINPLNNSILKKYIFPSKMNSPLNLQADSDGDTLLYIDGNIKAMNIASSDLPAEAFIERDESMFYKIGINPVNGDIVATDAIDYQQNGYFMIFDRKGKFISDHTAGIIPGNVFFMVNQGHIIE